MTTQVTFTMQVRTANDAYQNQNHRAEMVRTLELMAESIRDGAEGQYILFDSNGNRVGDAMFEVWEI